MQHARTMRVASLCLCLFLPALLMATPPQPETQWMIENGQIPMPFAYEHSMMLHDMGVDAPMGVTLTGNELDVYNFNAIVLLADFPDQPSMTPPPLYDNLVFANMPGTVWDYFQEVSYGEFQLTTADFPSMTAWWMMPNPYSYYVAGQNGFGPYPTNCQRMVEDVVMLADPMVNFAQYDHDGNGSVDGLVVVHTGTDAAWSGSNNDVWSHAWSLPAPMWTADGVYISTYAMVPEFYMVPGDLTPGVFCHEMGHSVLGLPDLYDLDYSSYGLGQWSVMSFGMWNGPISMGSSPAHPDAWSRTLCSFGAPENVFHDILGLPLAPIEQSPQYFRLWGFGAFANEYFLAENRQPIGFDSFIPGAGLLIYHIDDNVTTWNCNEWYPGYIAAGHYRVALEQADGVWDLEQMMNMGDGADPYPGWSGNTFFDFGTLPNNLDYNFNPSNAAVRNVMPAPPISIQDFVVGSPAPINPPAAVACLPHFMPIYIPANGGTFGYDVFITNNLMAPRTGHLWFDAILPNGSRYFVNRLTVTLQPGITWQSLNRVQNVPAMAPPGAYQFVARIGGYPSFVYDEFMFPFMKQALVADGDEIVGSWLTEEMKAEAEQYSGEIDWLNDEALPETFTVSDPWPNPFNARASINIALPADGEVNLAVYNTLGQLVDVLADGYLTAGSHSFTMDASSLTSGMYFLVAQTGTETATRKLVVMK